MEIDEQTHGEVRVLRPLGPLTREDAAQFRDRALAVAASSLGRVVVDASSMAYVDSSGLEVLADLAEALAAGGRSLKLAGVNETMLEILDITNQSELYDLYEDVNPAVRSFLS